MYIVMSVDLLAHSAHSPGWIIVQQLLVNRPLARLARTVASVIKTFKRTAHLINEWIALECKKGFKLVVEERSLKECFTRHVDGVITFKMIVQTRKDHQPHPSLALSHDQPSFPGEKLPRQ